MFPRNGVLRSVEGVHEKRFITKRPINESLGGEGRALFAGGLAMGLTSFWPPHSSRSLQALSDKWSSVSFAWSGPSTCAWCRNERKSTGEAEGGKIALVVDAIIVHIVKLGPAGPHQNASELGSVYIAHLFHPKAFEKQMTKFKAGWKKSFLGHSSFYRTSIYEHVYESPIQ